MAFNQKKFEDLSYTISCCKCGISIIPNCFNMCNRCKMSEINIVDGIKTSYIIESCKKCERYHIPPKKWMNIADKAELLSYIFVRYKEIRDLPIISSNFIETEEHSKQLILQLEIEKESIKKQFKIFFKLRNKQCSDCDKVEAKQYWTSIVQVRQRSNSKRTFLFLEQAILKHKMYKDCSNIKERKDGIDFYYIERKGPHKMISFLDTQIGTKTIQSNKLMTEDRNSNKMKYKFSHSVEIFSLCKDDLVIIDEPLAKKKNVGRLLIVSRVTTKIVFVDPLTGKTCEINKQVFFAEKESFRVILGSKDLKLYTVTEIEKNYDRKSQKSDPTAIDCFITSDYDDQIHCKTHLTFLEDGDQIYGYDLGNANLHFIDRDQFKVIIVRKKYENLGINVQTEKAHDREYQFFLEDMLFDSEMRKNVNIFDKTNQIIENFENFKL
ncbi:NMD protein affecting ribosome stability and mRNA decay [Pseudoloma neurophilia]|uniref:60S ribosomal export protein NMD3 n=1 Tax=Pseudoloma neurophilia TaxID=146866 RepID=A0A0R0M4L8_9MICR|nr:NMD protein affecting ribosome stability and mRNA decay [Pseudoloma neurophilia]